MFANDLVQLANKYGMQQGMQQGRIEEQRAFVQRLLRARIDMTQIQEVSGLSFDEIEKIRLKS